MKATITVLMASMSASAQADEVWRLADIATVSPVGWAPDPPPVVEIIDDFDGDGTLDHLRVLSRVGADRHALVATLNEGTEAFQVIYFDVDMKHVGLRPVPPGVYKTLCGKGYSVCENGAPAVRALTRPGFELVYWEKASSLFYWDETVPGFVSFPTSD